MSKQIPQVVFTPLITFILFLIFPPVSANDFAKVEIKTIQVSDSIYMLEGSGGNIGLCVGPDGAFIVDDQYAPLTPKITAAIAKITDKPVEFIINTHHHHDHTGGNENFGKAGALIVSHENSRKRIEAEQRETLTDPEKPDISVAALPKITFSRTMTFHYNGEAIIIYYLGNAHTDGDAIVHFSGANVFHMGDVFVRYGFPYIDMGKGGNILGMIEVNDHLLGMMDDETKIIPGHGQLASRRELAAFNSMLKTISSRVKAYIDEGKNLQQIIQLNPTKGFEERGVKTADFIKVIYDSINQSG